MAQNHTTTRENIVRGRQLLATGDAALLLRVLAPWSGFFITHGADVALLAHDAVADARTRIAAVLGREHLELPRELDDALAGLDAMATADGHVPTEVERRDHAAR